MFQELSFIVCSVIKMFDKGHMIQFRYIAQPAFGCTMIRVDIYIYNHSQLVLHTLDACGAAPAHAALRQCAATCC